MSESSQKSDIYELLIKQTEALIDTETDLITSMANISALLHEQLKMHWTGFYRVAGNKLILGPFQGPPACTVIQKGKGVCGTAWQSEKTIIVKNVHDFDGHIACSPHSNSEIVVPVIAEGKIIGVLDIDSVDFSAFDTTDAYYLEKIMEIMVNKHA